MADPITWGDLAKAIGENTTIDQEIANLILAHNLDPSAHGQTNEAVYTHRIAEALDHLYGSVDLKHLVADKIAVLSMFESIDGWHTNGTFTLSIFEGVLDSGPSNTNRSELWFETSANVVNLDFTKEPFFQTTCYFSYNTSQIGYIICGSIPEVSNQDCFGFKVNDGNLYACTFVSGSEHLHQITGIDITELHVYRAYLNVGGTELYFYIDGVLQYTQTTNLPVTVTNIFMCYYIKTQTNNNRFLTLVDLMFEQDR